MPDTSDAVDQAERLDQIGFPEFTSKLVSDTFNSVVSAMIHQEQTYADIVKKVAMTEEEFAQNAVGAKQVDDWLAKNFPGDGKHATTVRKGNKIAGSQAGKLHDALQQPAKQAKNVKAKNLPDGGSGKVKIDDDALSAVRGAIKRALAAPRQQALEELVEKGVVRVVLDDGTIHTDLDFHTHASESSSTHTHHKHENDESVTIGGDFVEGLFAIGGSASAHHMSVSTRTSKQQSESSSDVDIQGHVELNLEGDYQPLKKPPKDDGS